MNHPTGGPTRTQAREVGKWFQRDLKGPFVAKDSDKMEVLYFCTPVIGEEFLEIILRDVSLAQVGR
jgi:hypothetical protein